MRETVVYRYAMVTSCTKRRLGRSVEQLVALSDSVFVAGSQGAIYV